MKVEDVSIYSSRGALYYVSVLLSYLLPRPNLSVRLHFGFFPKIIGTHRVSDKGVVTTIGNQLWTMLEQTK